MTKDDFWQGVRGGFPVMVSASPFGALFGALAVDNGFSVFDAVFMSATVYAGASQMVGIELFGHNVQPWLIVLSIFAVNFRHILYSASIARHIRHFSRSAEILHLLPAGRSAISPKREARRARQAGDLCLVSRLCADHLSAVADDDAAGAIFGQMIGDPKAIGLDVLLPIYFMGLVLGFRKRDNWLPVVAVSSLASIAAMHFVGSPWHVSIGAIAGIAACRLPAAVETASKSR